jgi:hypothetical protein
VLKALLDLALVLAILVGLLWFGQRRLIYFPDSASPPPAATQVPGARDVSLATADGLILGAWLVPPAAHALDMVVLVLPGNAGSRADRAPLAVALARAGFTVLLVDYRGYGGNPGRPDEAGLAMDAQAALSYLESVEGFSRSQIIYFGESLGAAVATRLAVTAPASALVLRSPFVDLAAVGRYHYPWLPVGPLLRDRFPVAELVGEVTVPCVVIYGGADSIVPPQQSIAVAQRAGGPAATVVVTGADHNDRVLLDGAQIIDAVAALAR